MHGVRDVERIITLLDLIGAVPDFSSALDFGCGVGRLTRPLAQHFGEVTGIDVSASMLEVATQLSGPEENCRYVLKCAAGTLPLADASQDFVLSCSIVLQHIPSPMSRAT